MNFTEFVNLTFSNIDQAISYLSKNTPKKSSKKTISKIAIFVYALSNGGAERVAALMSSIFTSLGYEVVFLTRKKSSDYAIPPNTKVITIPENKKRWQTLRQSLLEENVDTVITIDHLHGLTLSDILICKYLGLNVIVQEHCSFFLPFYASDLWLLEKRKAVYKLADAVTCLNEHDQFMWQESGIQRCLYVPNPLSFDRTKVATPLAFSQRENSVIFIGRLTELKGVRYLPKLIDLVSSQIPDVKFYILGRWGSRLLKRNFEASIKGMNSFIGFLGHTNNVDSFLNKAKVHINLSQVEGSPMVLNEARICGTPSVLFAKKYLDNAQQGCIHIEDSDINHLANQVCQLITNQQYWEKLSIEAQQNLDQWETPHLKTVWQKLFTYINNDSWPIYQQNESLASELTALYDGLKVYNERTLESKLQNLKYCQGRNFKYNVLKSICKLLNKFL